MILVGGAMVGIFFNNCSPQHNAQTTDGFSLAEGQSIGACAFKDEMDLYSKSYWGFLTNHCSACHVEGGQGKGTFASSGLQVAYNAFTVVGYEMISDYAVNPGHKPPYTGTQNSDDIDLLKQQWVKGLENITACKNGTTPVDLTPTDESLRLETRSLGVNAVDATPVTITWDLNADFLVKAGVTIPTLPGATLSLNVKKATLGAKPVYEISLPRIKAGASDVKVRSVLVKLNGKLIPNQTTFRYVDEGVYAGSTVVLAPGAMVVDGVISPTDVISLSIGDLATVTLPPPPVKPVVGFTATSMSVSETVNASAKTSSQNLLMVNLTLSIPNPDQYVTATVGVVTTGIAANQLATNRRSMTVNFDGTDKVIDHWDWDYSIDSLAVVFAPGETSKSLIIKISKDDRDEADELLRLKVTSAVNATISTTLNTETITILDNDGPNTSGAPSFSSLMQSGGVLYSNCLECHNSIDNRGGYNLSDYDLMIENGVLVPGNTNSKMFQRMNSVTPGLRPMPLGGLLDTTLRRQVENWILGGAKND